MAAITSLLDVKIQPDHVGEAREVIERILVATRAFSGCLGVDVLVDVADEAHFMLVEKWESLEHDDAYRAWRATPEGASALNGILESRHLTRLTAA
jgi:heme oxygenase (mycobilin-producing)